MSTPPAIGLRPIDPGPFALRHEPIAVPAGSGLDAVALDRRLRPVRARLDVPLAARLAQRAARRLPVGPRGLRRRRTGIRRGSTGAATGPARVLVLQARRRRAAVGGRHRPPGATATSRSSPRTASRSRPTPAGSPGARTCSTSPTPRAGCGCSTSRRFAAPPSPRPAGTGRSAKGLRFSYASVDDGRAARCSSASTPTRCRAPGSCAGRSRPAGCSRRSRRATRG